MRDSEHLRELIPAYAIGATDDDETRLLESALAEHPDLADELREYQRMSDTLAESVPAMRPPPELLGNLLAAASQARPASISTPAVNILPRQTQRRVPWRFIAASLTLFLVLTNAFWLYRASVPAVREINLWGAGAVDAQQIAMRCRIILSPNSDSAVMIAQNFPILDDSSTYQVWLRRDGSVVSLGIFDVDGRGGGVLSFASDALSAPFESIGVTVEPSGGSPAPTTPSLVRWKST